MIYFICSAIRIVCSKSSSDSPGKPTIKSDDIIGRNKVYKAIVDGEPMPKPGIPEAFRALIKELQGLGLSVRLVNQEGKDVANESLVEQFAEAKASVKQL